MTDDERTAIVESIIRSCMWGHGGIASVILEDLDKRMPGEPKWQKLYRDNEKRVRRETVGVITDDERLTWCLRRGYWLTNYDEDGCALFNPPPMNGLSSYVSKELADLRRPPKPFDT